MIILDDWQKEFIEFKGNKILVAGRQTGKSEAQGYDNAEFAANNPGTTCLIISKTQRQSEELLIKTLNFLQFKYPKMIGRGKLKPLKQTVWVDHGKGKKPSRVISLPIGLAAAGIRGYTIHKLSVDEAQLPPDEVFNAVSPMLLTTGGTISLTGTPQGKKGFFWRAFENKNNLWKVFHVNSLEVLQKRPISLTWPQWRRDTALEFLKREQSWMSDKHFRQEYMGEFVEDLDRVFSDDWIKNVCVIFRNDKILDERYYTVGVDVGRTIDPSAFAIFDGTDKENIVLVDCYERKDWSIPSTAREVINIKNRYNKLRNAGIDGAGVGAGVIDILLEDSSIASIVQDLNNARRSVDFDGLQNKKLLKEDMYRTTVILGEKNKLKLLQDEQLIDSLRSCQIEYKQGTNIPIIFGNNTHLAEAIIRGVYPLRRKTLNLFATYSKAR